MAGSKEENSKRLRYIRLLGRFISGILSYLAKSDNPTKEQYDQKVDMNFRFLEKNEAVKLYKNEYTELEALGQKTKRPSKCRLPNARTKANLPRVISLLKRGGIGSILRGKKRGAQQF